MLLSANLFGLTACFSCWSSLAVASSLLQVRSSTFEGSLEFLTFESEWRMHGGERNASDMPKLLYTPPNVFEPISPELFQNAVGSAIEYGKERPEHSMLVKYLKPEAKVMELGTRYGSSSCVMAWIQKNSGQLVSVEGDSTVWEANAGNMKRLNCKNKAWHGFVSRKYWKKSKTKNGSEWTTKFEVTDHAAEANVPSTTFDDMQRDTGIIFDTFLIDCEGCFDKFLLEFPDAVDRVQMILLEADYGIGWQREGYADYSRVTKFLEGKGFALKEKKLVQDEPLEGDGKIYFYVFERPSNNF